jgi:hypothetical protein
LISFQSPKSLTVKKGIHLSEQVADASKAYYEKRKELLQEEHQLKIKILQEKQQMQRLEHEKKMELLHLQIFQQSNFLNHPTHSSSYINPM